MPSDLPVVRLKPHEDRRVRVGHPWIFSNEIDVTATPIKGLTPGAMVRVEDARLQPLGIGYAHPGALICVRLLSRQTDCSIDAGWLRERLAQALALRERVYPRPFYRLVFGEADGLPGLVIDRFAEVLAVQIATAGMEAMRDWLVEALEDLLAPRTIVFRDDAPARAMEGLSAAVQVQGAPLERLDVPEGDAVFRIDPVNGQKTGWYYDQRDNRTRFLRYVRGARVLDCFSYVGAWGVRAAMAGAAAVTCVDSSATALAQVADNAEHNRVTITTEKSDVSAALRAFAEQGRQFDVVVLDPPALIKRRRDRKAGMAHYGRLNYLALRVLAPGGVLVSASCSYHLSAADLARLLLRESGRHGVTLQLLERGGQGPDHPVHAAIPETDYLKAFFMRPLAR